MESNTRIVDEQKKREHLEYSLWEIRETSTAIQTKMETQIKQQQEQLNNINEDMDGWVRMLRELKTWKANYSIWSTEL